MPTTVIGVMPRGFSFPQNQDLWVPLVPTPEVRRRDRRNTWFVFGRLSDGATIESARADMDAIGQRLARAWPASNAALRPEVRTFVEFFIGESAALIYRAMIGAVGFVLLIACANLASLLLARAAGRSREDLDANSGARVVLVNERFASEHWPEGNAIGGRLRLAGRQGTGDWMTIVGIVPNIVQNRLTRQVDPLVYLPFPQRPDLESPRAFGDRWLLVRTSTAATALVNSFRSEITAIDPEQSIGIGPLPLIQLMSRSYQFKAFTTTLFLICAAMALLLASIGLHAVIAYSVSRRTQEMGIRLAIGATAGDILALVMRQGMLPLSVGLAIGLVGSLGLNQLLQSQLVEVSPGDPLTYVIATLVLVASAALGCAIPARRAMRLDPVVALRQP